MLKLIIEKHTHTHTHTHTKSKTKNARYRKNKMFSLLVKVLDLFLRHPILALSYEQQH
jgi:hypothetical protein